jgi:hypothetical protein
LATLREMRPVVVIGATDNRESRLLVNRMCVLEDRPAIFAGVMRRAYGGQVLRVIPGLTACYQCFVSGLPEVASDQETSPLPYPLAYTDRPVRAEPGLSSDILPVALHVVRLAIIEALGDQPSALASLREDLVAPLYLWFNRREPKTDASSFNPLRDGVDGTRILRWYGSLIDRDPTCPACGDEVLTHRE